MDTKDTPDAKYIKDIFSFIDSEGPIIYLLGTNFTYHPLGNIYEDLTRTKEFSRLFNIKQLGLVSNYPINVGQNQTRAGHSYPTAIMMDIVLYRNNFSDQDRKLGIAAGLYHDLATVPYSDQGKLLKKGYYEEETLIEHLIHNSKDIKKRLKWHKICIDELINTIQGNGKIGELINSKDGIDVDNLSYLAIDQFHAGHINKSMQNLKEQKYIFDQHYNIRFIEGDWVFDNPKSLVKLLELRSLMYKYVYKNPHNRAKEAFFGRKLNDKHIDKDIFLKWNDSNFEKWFMAEFGPHEFELYFNNIRMPFKEVKREYDISKLEQLRNENNNPNIIIENNKPPRNAVSNLVLYKDKVTLLEEIPEFSADLERIKKTIEDLGYIGIYEEATEKECYDFDVTDKEVEQIVHM